MIDWLSAPADLSRLDVLVAISLFFVFVSVDLFFAVRCLFRISDLKDRQARTWMDLIDRINEAKK